MIPADVQHPVVLAPAEAAFRLGLSVASLVAIIRRHRYRFTELSAGGKPGDRGRNRWGLTEAQLDAIVRGQERGYVEPVRTAGPSAPSPMSPDGRSRLRKGSDPRRAR
jgi:hypothetical protein